MPLPSQRNTRHISLFSCPSHRHQPSPGAQVQLLSSDTFHPQVMEGEGTPPILHPLPKSSTSIFTETAFVAAENCASNLPQYCQYVPFQGRLSPPETQSKVYWGNFVRGQLGEQLGGNTRGNKEANPPPPQGNQFLSLENIENRRFCERVCQGFSMDGQLYAGINGMNQHPHKRAIQIAFMPFTIAKLFPKISTKPNQTKRAMCCGRMGALSRGINGEWSTMIPTNGLNGEDMRGATHGPFARHWHSLPASSLYPRYGWGGFRVGTKEYLFQNMSQYLSLWSMYW